MSEGMSADEQRGYREGVIEARLAHHDEHFVKLNGSMDANSQAIRELEKSTTIGFLANAKELSGINDHLIGIEIRLPKIQTLAESLAQEQEVAVRAAATLAQKKKDEESRWDHWRGTVAWLTGLIGFGLLVAEFILRLWGIG